MSKYNNLTSYTASASASYKIKNEMTCSIYKPAGLNEQQKEEGINVEYKVVAVSHKKLKE